MQSVAHFSCQKPLVAPGSRHSALHLRSFVKPSRHAALQKHECLQNRKRKSGRLCTGTCASAQQEAEPREDDVRSGCSCLLCSIPRLEHILQALSTSQVLPDSFLEALEHAAESTRLAVEGGANRCLVSKQPFFLNQACHSVWWPHHFLICLQRSSECACLWHEQVEILLLGLWDPSSGNLFAEEGDQQRFWKITRKFVEQVSSASGVAKVKAVRCLVP